MRKSPLRINPDYTWFKLKLVRSPIHRWGVVAEEAIPRRRYVIEYTGLLLNRRQAKARPKQKYCYSYQIDSKGYWILDATWCGSGAERINHSCDPNLYVWFDGKRVFFYARRAIKTGEELTVDYHFPWDSYDLIPCHCGSPKCRGTINDPGPKPTRKQKLQMKWILEDNR